jgi:hypothetical protein
MPANRLKEQLKRLQREIEEPETEADIPSDPVEWAESVLKLQCDNWQKMLLRTLAKDEPARVLCLCPRQAF